MESGHRMLDHLGSYQASRRRRMPVPALPPYLIESVWQQFSALIPARRTSHPLGCHRSGQPPRLAAPRAPTLDAVVETLGELPEGTSVHLDRGYDSDLTRER